MMGIHGVGPKTAKLLYERAGVASVERLEELAREHALAGIPGIQAKTEENILKGIAVWRSGRERMPWVRPSRSPRRSWRHWVSQRDGPDQPGGSVRRMRETVKDIDVLITSETPARVMVAFVALQNVAEVLAHGDTKSSIRLREGIQADPPRRRAGVLWRGAPVLHRFQAAQHPRA